MHELPIVKQILNVCLQYAEKEEAESIKSIRLCIGEANDLILEYVDKYFKYVSRGTIASEAKLELEMLPIICECNTCKEHIIYHLKGAERTTNCPFCGGEEFTMLNGGELFVDKIEIEKEKNGI